MIDRNELGELCETRDKLCNFCEADECENYIVSRLINDAYNKFEEED